MKVATRNNLLKKLSNSKWDFNANTIITTALALSYSAAEYACPVRTRSQHASKLDPELNDACRSIPGCLRSTNVEELYLHSGIAPPDIRRDVCSRVENKKQETNAADSLPLLAHPCTLDNLQKFNKNARKCVDKWKNAV